MKTVLMIASMICLTVTANLLLKTGAVASEVIEGSYRHLVNWRILAGIVCFGLAAICYILVLQWLPLSVANSFAAAQYIAVILAARFILSEPIASMQWAGMIMVGVGIAIVGMSQV